MVEHKNPNKNTLLQKIKTNIHENPYKLISILAIFSLVFLIIFLYVQKGDQTQTRKESNLNNIPTNNALKEYKTEGISLKIPGTWAVFDNPEKINLKEMNLPNNTKVLVDENNQAQIALIILNSSDQTFINKYNQWFTSLIKANLVLAQEESPDYLSFLDIPTTPDTNKFISNYTTKANTIIYAHINSFSPLDSQIMLSEDSSFTDAQWQENQGGIPFNFSQGDGEKTVYAKVKTAEGEIKTFSSTFYLDTKPPVGGIALDKYYVGPDIVKTKIYLGYEDNLSGVSAMRIDTDPTFKNAVWVEPKTALDRTYTNEEAQKDGAIYVQYRDNVDNVSETYRAYYTADYNPPIVYVEVETIPAGQPDTLTRKLSIYAYDELSPVTKMRITNDPLFLDFKEMEYTDSLVWNFDERRVVWVKVKDDAGNWSEPHPAYADEPKEAKEVSNKQNQNKENKEDTPKTETSTESLKPQKEEAKEDKEKDTPDSEKSNKKSKPKVIYTPQSKEEIQVASTLERLAKEYLPVGIKTETKTVKDKDIVKAYSTYNLNESKDTKQVKMWLIQKSNKKVLLINLKPQNSKNEEIIRSLQLD